MQNPQELYKIIIALVAVIVSSWGLFGFFVVRWIKQSDDNFKELFNRTRVPMEEHITNDLNRHIILEEKMERMKERIYDNERLLAETSIKVDGLKEAHNRYHK